MMDQNLVELATEDTRDYLLESDIIGENFTTDFIL